MPDPVSACNAGSPDHCVIAGDQVKEANSELAIQYYARACELKEPAGCLGCAEIIMSTAQGADLFTIKKDDRLRLAHYLEAYCELDPAPEPAVCKLGKDTRETVAPGNITGAMPSGLAGFDFGMKATDVARTCRGGGGQLVKVVNGVACVPAPIDPFFGLQYAFVRLCSGSVCEVDAGFSDNSVRTAGRVRTALEDKYGEPSASEGNFRCATEYAQAQAFRELWYAQATEKHEAGMIVLDYGCSADGQGPTLNVYYRNAAGVRNVMDEYKSRKQSY